MTQVIKKKPRIYVNLFGGPLILSCIYLGQYYFLSLFLIVSIFCVYELEKVFIKLNINVFSWVPYLILLIITLDQVQLIQFEFLKIAQIIIIICMIFPIFKNKKYNFHSIISTVFISLWIGIFFISILKIRNFSHSGYILTLIMFLSVWMCDSAAFLFGKKYGRKKIAPLVSPNKTLVGSLSGLFSVIIFMLSCYHFNLGGYDFTILETITFAFIFGAFSQFGDFFESKLKREAGVKDSSNILQGHGGFLDRFDSLLITAPLILFVLNF